MLYNSFEFLLFFPIVAIGYYLTGGGKSLSNSWLLLASYYFYINLKPIYALILLASTLITFFCGLLLERNAESVRKKKTILTASLVLNFSMLFVFKYYNFINGSIESLMSSVGLRWNVPYLNVLLPVGISFFTFQAAGYIIDVYRGTVKAEKNFLTYALFVSFFPVILAGPIQRAKNLIPQLKQKHPVLYDNVIGGLKMMLWGYFMKLCVADRLGTYVDAAYSNYAIHNGTTLAIAAIFYSIQIYCDFAGYSLTAIGCARVMGFTLPENFKRPYFSTSIQDFWRRWHIALSTWFRDYLYIPLGGNRVKYSRYLVNILIVFLVSGLWHGAGWTFVVWGGLHGIFQVIESLMKRNNKTENTLPMTGRLCKIVVTFLLATIAWVFFRADSLEMACTIVGKTFSDFGKPFISPEAMLFGLLSILILSAKDIADEFYPRIAVLNSSNKYISGIAFSVLTVYIILFGVLDGSQFIYFQF